MTERSIRSMTKITAAGLAAGVATWNAAGQSPPTILPVPDLPKIAFPELPAPSPQAPAIPHLAQPVSVSKPEKIAKPVSSVFNLQPEPSGHNLKSDGVARETLASPAPAIPAVTPSPQPIFTATVLPEVPPMRFEKTLLSAVVSAALAAAPVHAKDEPSKIPLASESDKKQDENKANLIKNEDPKKDAVDLKKEIDSVKALLETMNAKQKQLGDAVLGKGEGKDQDAGALKKLDDLAASIKTLDETVKKLEEKMAKFGDNIEKIRVANSSPLTNKDTAKEATKANGIVKLINGYADRVTMIINGHSYRLEPGETKDISVPSGKFDYALPQAGGEIKTSSVKDNEIVTLRIK
ncbi:MAG: hypothetical protein U0798_07860 [Gemmataceae bacterium]